MPECRPTTPLSTGPTMFLAPSPIWWQILHLEKTFSPAAASCAAAAPTEARSAAPADVGQVLALGEDPPPGGGILRRRGANRSQERRPGNRKTQQPHIPLRIWVIPMPPVGDANHRANA